MTLEVQDIYSILQYVCLIYFYDMNMNMNNDILDINILLDIYTYLDFVVFTKMLFVPIGIDCDVAYLLKKYNLPDTILKIQSCIFFTLLSAYFISIQLAILFSLLTYLYMFFKYSRN